MHSLVPELGEVGEWLASWDIGEVLAKGAK